MTIHFKFAFPSLIVLLLVLSGCTEKTSEVANETYKYWAGEEPPREIEVLNGQYWESSHWTKEYIMYLKCKPKKIWWDNFLQNNHPLVIDTTNWTVPDDAPSWFIPNEKFIRFRRNDSFDQGSRIFKDSTTDTLYIYEIQL